MKLTALLLVLLVCGCEACPPVYIPVKQWSKDEQAQIAAEHNKLQPDSILRPVLDEWEKLRRELR